MKPLGILVNPSAGGGDGLTVGNRVFEVLEAKGIDVIDLTARDAAAAETKARQAIADQRISALVVVGGDGVVHLGVNACAGTEVPLGIIPAGTGNDAAQSLEISTTDIDAAIQTLLANLSGELRVDLGRATTSAGNFWFFCTVSAGFDSLVNRRANSMRWPRGPIRYQVAMVLELLNFKGTDYVAEIDGVERKFRAMLCAVVNNGVFGGGMRIVPDASITDGQLNLFIVHQITRRELIKVFPKVYSGRHVTHPAVEILTAQSIKLMSAEMPAYSDGEAVGYPPIRAEVVPKTLRVCAAAAP